MRLISFGPAGFDAYARIRFIPDPDMEAQIATEPRGSEGYSSDIEQARRALYDLARFTDTPHRCYFCMWDGYSDVQLPAGLRRDRMIHLPHRSYVLFAGSLTDVDRWEEIFCQGRPCPPPAFVWPADKQWCFVSDVDQHWAGVGATRDAIDSLIADDLLDAVPANPVEDQSKYS